MSTKNTVKKEWINIMAVFQTETIDGGTLEEIRQQAVYLPCGLGDAISMYGLGEATTFSNVQLADAHIKQYHRKGCPFYACRIENTNTWLVGGRFKD